jgi:alpha-tubulin suppressor-like RCC1 family protein
VFEVKGKPFVDICFTKLRLFALTEKGEVYMYSISETFPENSEALMEKDIKVIYEFDPNPRHVVEFKNIARIEAGESHLIALDKNGKVFAMGDDTFGQCG